MIANREMCELMGQTASVDRANNYRCDAVRGGAVGGKLDVGVSYLSIGMRWAAYSVAPQCDATNGCLGINAAPREA